MNKLTFVLAGTLMVVNLSSAQTRESEANIKYIVSITSIDLINPIVDFKMSSTSNDSISVLPLEKSEAKTPYVIEIESRDFAILFNTESKKNKIQVSVSKVSSGETIAKVEGSGTANLISQYKGKLSYSGF